MRTARSRNKETPPTDRDYPGQRPPKTETTLDKYPSGTRERDPPRKHMGPVSRTGSDIIQRPTRCGQTDTSKNITLPQTSFTGGKNVNFVLLVI